MEVNDVKNDALREVGTSSNSSLTKVSPLAQDSTTQTEAASDSVSVNLSTREDAASTNETRASLNKIIAVVNVASEAATKIGTIVQSLGGIAEQASDPSQPPHRREALVKEADQLVTELQSTMQTKAPDGSRPLAGDKIRVEIEEKLGKALDLLLPDHSKDSLGLKTLNLTTKESIIQTKTVIETAKRQIEELHRSIEASRGQVQDLVDRADVAAQNNEAAQSSVRNLDAALTLAGDAQKGIEENPRDAMQSLNKMHDVVHDLLK